MSVCVWLMISYAFAYNMRRAFYTETAYRTSDNSSSTTVVTAVVGYEKIGQEMVIKLSHFATHPLVWCKPREAGEEALIEEHIVCGGGEGTATNGAQTCFSGGKDLCTRRAVSKMA